MTVMWYCGLVCGIVDWYVVLTFRCLLTGEIDENENETKEEVFGWHRGNHYDCFCLLTVISPWFCLFVSRGDRE
jgi:hypothetical protein